MAYIKQDWKDFPNETTPITAERMNHIEEGIYENSNLDTEMSTISEKAVQNKTITNYIGEISNLNTTDKSSVINALNEVVDNYKPINLYENTAGTNGNITLSDNASNYKYIEIYYFIRIAEDSYSSTKCYDPNGKEVFLLGATNTAQNIDFNFAQKVINGTQITTKYYGRLFSTFGSSGMTFGKNNNVWITKVVGYKY